MCFFKFELENERTILAEHTSICIYHDSLQSRLGRLSSVVCAFFSDGQFDTFGEVRKCSWNTNLKFSTDDIISIELLPQHSKYSMNGETAEQIDMRRFIEEDDIELVSTQNQDKFWTIVYKVNQCLVYRPVQLLGIPTDNRGFSVGVFLPVIQTSVRILGIEDNISHNKEKNNNN